MENIQFENSDKVCFTVLVKPYPTLQGSLSLVDYISSKLDNANIEHVHITGDSSDRDKIIRDSYFVSNLEAEGYYYTMYIISISQKDKATKCFNIHGHVIDIRNIN